MVDSNVALKWVLAEQDSPIAQALFDEWTQSGTLLLAPDLFVYETTKVLFRNTLVAGLSMSDARDGVVHLLTLGIDLIPISGSDLSLRAMEFAERFHLPATYDPHYLALAEREGCEFWTADERLWNSVKADLPWVRWLGEHVATP